MIGEINFPQNRFTVWDYLVFGLSLLLSLLIGLYHAYVGSKKKTTNEFLLAGRSMGVFPVAASILASFMSAITLLGTPAEVITRGAMYFVVTFGYIFSIGLTVKFFVPVFYALNVTSVFEYIEMRFNTTVRITVCGLYLTQTMFYMSMVLYIPCLALGVVTGFNKWLAVVCVGAVCVLYTSLGGMKAVLWTDVAQTVLMFLGMLSIVIRGCLEFKGLLPIWAIAKEHQRFEFFDFNPDPRVKNTMWSMLIGGTILWLSLYAVNQAQVQRILCTPTLKKAKQAMLWNIPGLLLLMLLVINGALVVFAHYHKCNPLSMKRIGKYEEILPLYIMDMMNYPGFPGFLIACILSGSLSTISSGLNSLAAIFQRDIFAIFCGESFIERKSFISLKIITCLSGIVMMLLTVLIAQMGAIIDATQGIFGMLGGPVLGIFVLGIFIPWTNSKGALFGLFFGLFTGMWIGICASVYKPPEIGLAPPPMETTHCETIYGTINGSLSEDISGLKYNYSLLRSFEEDRSTKNNPAVTLFDASTRGFSVHPKTHSSLVTEVHNPNGLTKLTDALRLLKRPSRLDGGSKERNLRRRSIQQEGTNDGVKVHESKRIEVKDRFANISAFQRFMMPVYQMSKLWYCAFAAFVTVVSGLIVSFITGANSPDDVDPTLLSPTLSTIEKFLPKEYVLRKKMAPLTESDARYMENILFNELPKEEIKV